jgi:hypothetical protein
MNKNRRMGPLTSLALALAASSTTAVAQSSSLEGMWSDPPATPEDASCFSFCTQVELDYLAALLADPKNDDRGFGELMGESAAYQVEKYIRPRLSAAALESFPLDQLEEDPGYLHCEPWGMARQMVAPHQLELQRVGDRLEMHYGEWDARRTVHMDGRAAPAGTQPSSFGYSVGRYEGDTLVIETTHIGANITLWWSRHSDQLRITERYRRDGDRLLLTATMEDPWGLREPLEIKKVWGWAPDQKIYPYVDCKPAAESAKVGGK